MMTKQAITLHDYDGAITFTNIDLGSAIKEFLSNDFYQKLICLNSDSTSFTIERDLGLNKIILKNNKKSAPICNYEFDSKKNTDLLFGE